MHGSSQKPRSAPAGPETGLKRMRMRWWRPMWHDSPRGFALGTLPIGAEIEDVAVHFCGQPMIGEPTRLADAGSRWPGAARPRAEICYWLPVGSSTRSLAAEFGHRVVELVRAVYPGTQGCGRTS
jgi:hypothetical protein